MTEGTVPLPAPPGHQLTSTAMLASAHLVCGSKMLAYVTPLLSTIIPWLYLQMAIDNGTTGSPTHHPTFRLA